MRPQNFMEFLGSCVMLRLHPPFQQLTCVCAQTDATNAEGWMHSTCYAASSFANGVTSKEDETKLAIARWLGNFVTDSEICLYSQWFPGNDNDANDAADSLSRDQYLTHAKLTHLLQSCWPKQLPTNFYLVQVPNNVSSSFYSMLPKRPATEPLLLQPTQSKLAIAAAGTSSVPTWVSKMTISWTDSTLQHASNSLAPLPTQSASAGSPPPPPNTHSWPVGSSILASGRPDPQLDASGNTAPLLQRQYQGYSNTDKPTNGQKALPPATPSEVLLSVLAIAAFFFAMRSCKYLLVEGARRTHILRKADIRFFIDSVVISHASSQHLAKADAVIVTFRWQKNDYRQATITMYRTNHPILCPVRAWATIVQHLLSLPQVSTNTPVCALTKDGTITP